MPRTTTQVTIKSVSQWEEPQVPLSALRQSVEADLPHIQALETPLTRAMFGDLDLKVSIEKCVCKTLVNECDDVVAFLVVMDHPNVPSVFYCHWYSWIRRLYRIDFATSWNTYFIHYLVWDPKYPNFFAPCLKSLYKNNVKLEHVVVVTPPGFELFPELEPMFTMVYPSSSCAVIRSSPNVYQNLHFNLRHRVMTKLTVRKASDEDNIDVQPLVYHQLDVLKYVYGDIKLDAVIDVRSTSKAVLVAEKSSVTVGVMTLSSKVDYNHINFFFFHVLETKSRDSMFDRVVRQDTMRSDGRRGLPFTPETMVTDEQLSIELNFDNLTVNEEEEEEEDERDEMVVYWDEDGDMFRVVDPVMEYLLHMRDRNELDSFQIEFEDTAKRESSDLSKNSLGNTYWGRPSWSNSFLPLTREDSLTRDQVTTVKREDATINGVSPVENAFLITLLALHPDLDVRYGYDLLEASFECYPDKPFCLLSLPTAYQGSPLTQHMIRMTPKLSWDFPHELYVTHRNAMFSEFNVRPLTVVDHVSVVDMLENMSQGKKIYKDVTKILLSENSGCKGFILECEGTTVGIAIVSTNFGLYQLTPYFKIDRLINIWLHYNMESHGLIRHLVLCPIFLKSASFFLRQIMHQVGIETLSFCLHHDEAAMSQNDTSLITVLGEMTPVLPRRRIRHDLVAIEDFKPQDYIVNSEYEFALFVATEKLLSIPKLELNYRIVVVGGSETALSFLENLIFSSARKHIVYNNIVLVSIHGFPLELIRHMAGDRMVPHSGTYTREYLSRIYLSVHVNILYGALTVINRNERMICLNKDHWLRYDYLFLMTGLQFCKPWPAVEPKSESVCTRIASDNDSSQPELELPKKECHKNEDLRDLYNSVAKQYGDNLFVINTTADAVIALSHLKRILRHKKEGKILIYGQGLNTYTCVESLLCFGVPGHKIVLVLAPAQDFDHNCLELNPLVEKAVIGSTEELGVTVHRGFSLVRWTLKHKYLDKVMFRDNDNVPLTLECIALFCYAQKCTNAKTYSAVNDAGIVFNDGIIIDTQFRTNDEFIYAAGPGTRYSNRFSPTRFAHHRFYNSNEIGLHMSKTFRRVVEPQCQNPKSNCTSSHQDFSSHQEFSSRQEFSSHRGSSSNQGLGEKTSSATFTSPPSKATFPRLSQPVTWVAQLPGGWNYVIISAPGRPVPLECQYSGQGDTGPILVTGAPILPDGPGYFQLSFSVYNTVREVVLLSKNEILFDNYVKLYGKHEKLLNNVYEHYNQGLIADLYAFFSQPWTYAIYTSRFDDLCRQCAEMFVTSEAVGLPALRGLDDEGLARLRADHEVIQARYLASPVPTYVDHLTLSYTGDRPLQLPMYFTDATLAAYTPPRSPYTCSPLHRDPYKLRQKSKSSSSNFELSQSKNQN